MKDHRLIDERSLAYHRIVAERLRAKPDLVGLARSNIARWLATCSPGTRTTLIEWRELLDRPLEELIESLVSKDERAVRLRQSSPFAGALTAPERFAVLRRFQNRDAVTA